MRWWVLLSLANGQLLLPMCNIKQQATLPHLKTQSHWKPKLSNHLKLKARNKPLHSLSSLLSLSLSFWLHSDQYMRTLTRSGSKPNLKDCSYARQFQFCWSMCNMLLSYGCPRRSTGKHYIAFGIMVLK